MSIVAAVLIFGLLVLVHEFGHFLFAKLNGIGVLEFSLGMGPRLFSFQAGGTRYSVKIFPFGGSCMMLGEDEENEDQAAFNNKSVWARISVVAAGPVFNFLLALGLSMVVIGFYGYGQAVVKEVEKGYPAMEAGLLPGDRIVKINGRRVHSYEDVTLYTATHPGQEIQVVYDRQDGQDGKSIRQSVAVTPRYSQEQGGYLLGVYFDGTMIKTRSPFQILVQGVYQVEYWIRYVFDTFYMMFHGLVGFNDLSGPVGIVSAIGTTVDEAMPYGTQAVLLMLANFCVLLSANLGVMNLLPIPALDGGRLVFLFVEAILRKPIDKEKEGMVHLAGMIFLLGLMMLVLLNDIRKLF